MTPPDAVPLRLREWILSLALLALVIGPLFAVCWHLRQRKGEAGAPLVDAVIGTLQGDTRIVQLGDVSHQRNARLMQWLAERDNLRQLKAAGFTALCLESSANLQLLAMSVAEGSMTAETFARKAVALGYVQTGGDNRRRFQCEGRIIRAAYQEGLQVHLSDQGNGDPELRAYQRARQKARLNGPLGDFGPEGESRKRWPLLTPQERADLEKLRTVWRQARLNDTALAKHLAGLVAKGDRILLVYGAGHGSGAHDLDELLAEKGIQLVRINVHPDRGELEEYGTNEADPPTGDYVFSEQSYFPRSGVPSPVVSP